MQTVCQHRKNIKVPKHFMAFLRSLVIDLTISVKNYVNFLLPRADICQQLKATHNTTKYAPYLRWRHGEKSISLVEMNISALRLIIGEPDPVVFIFK